MDYETAKARKLYLEGELKKAAEVMRSYPVGAMGLTPDHVKATAEWKADYRAYWAAHTALTTFNEGFIRSFKKELIAERRVKYGY